MIGAAGHPAARPPAPPRTSRIGASPGHPPDPHELPNPPNPITPDRSGHPARSPAQGSDMNDSPMSPLRCCGAGFAAAATTVAAGLVLAACGGDVDAP